MKFNKFKKASIWQVVKQKIKWIVKILNYPFKKLEELMQEEKMILNFRTLKASEIDVKPQTVKENGFSLLLYKNARVDMDVLAMMKIKKYGLKKKTQEQKVLQKKKKDLPQIVLRELVSTGEQVGNFTHHHLYGLVIVNISKKIKRENYH